MPRVASKTPDDPIVVALDSGALTAPDGAQYLIRAGERYRSSDAVVRHFPHLFADADSSDFELRQAREKLVAGRW